jgi:septal ring factor EnvC (AmiA/AmiB activator)
MNEWFKKNWKYLTAFLSGIVALIGFNRIRLPKQSQSGNEYDGNNVEQLRDTVGNTEQQVESIRQSNAELTNSISETRDTVSELRADSGDINSTSRELGNSISRIQSLIDEERKRITELEKLE